MATKPLDTFYFHLLWLCVAACAGLTAGAGLTDLPSLRLDGGDVRCEGVVQHRHDNDWLPLCITYFSRNLESLICREMKCGPPISHHPIDHRPFYNSSTALNVTCPLLDDWRNCSVSPVPATECDGAAFLYCAEERLLRLSGGGSRCAGRVEVLKDDVWGAVCDDHWDALDAEVACRQLGCGSALAAYGASHFGVGPPQIHLDDVRCAGSEPFLWECPSERRHDCTEREHAGVTCTGHRDVRLSGGPNNCSGRLEVYMDGVWATVCDGSWFDDDSAKVCKALGCGSFVKNAKYEHTLSTSVTFLCSHSYSLWDCKILTKNPNTCRQAKAVGIVCNRSGNFYDEMTTVTSSTHSDPTSLQTGLPPVRSDSTHSYFVIVCALLLILLLMSVLVFTIIIWRLRLKKKSTEQNPSLVRHNEYRDFRASTLRPAQPPDDSLQIPILYTGHIPPSPRTRHMEPVPAAIPRVPPTAALDDEEDYGFSSAPPKPLATFQDSFREDVFSAPPPPPPPPMTEYPNPEKATVGSRGSSSTSSGEHNWYENYRYPGEGAQDLMPPPQSYDGSSEYDDVNSLASV